MILNFFSSLNDHENLILPIPEQDQMSQPHLIGRQSLAGRFLASTMKFSSGTKMVE